MTWQVSPFGENQIFGKYQGNFAWEEVFDHRARNTNVNYKLK
jgi:hypothetical protein